MARHVFFKLPVCVLFTRIAWKWVTLPAALNVIFVLLRPEQCIGTQIPKEIV